jgi:large subunit ribosomal protein L13
MIVVDGTGLVVGRVATFVAKQAILGETVRIINCEKMYITGSRTFLIEDTHRKRVQGTWAKGPFYFRRPDRFVRRIVRGMIPYRTARGSAAYKRVLCYVDAPEAFKNDKAITIEAAHVRNISNLKYVTVSELCRQMGAKF